MAARLLPFHIIHVLAVSAWAGGLPAWIGLVWTVGRSANTERCDYTTVALNRFSRLATICVFVTVVSGVALAVAFVDTQGDLLGTRYGLLICGKVAVLSGILLIANHIRRAFLPAVTAMSRTRQRFAPAARWVALELGLGGRGQTAEKIVSGIMAAGVEFIDENGGGPGVRLRKPPKQKR